MTNKTKNTEKCITIDSRHPGTGISCNIAFRRDKVLYINYEKDLKAVQIGFEGGGDLSFSATIQTVNFIRQTVFGDIDPIENS